MTFNDAVAADPNVATNRISLQQLGMENRAGLLRLTDMVSADIKTLAAQVDSLTQAVAFLQRDNAALKNQLIAASKGMNVGFTNLPQQPQMQPVGIGVPTSTIRPQSVNINHNEDAGNVQSADAWTQSSAVDIQGSMGDADSVFYSGGE